MEPTRVQPLQGPVAGTRFEVDWVAETGSTNDDLLDAARAGAPEGLVRVADFQSAGRGRLDRRWEAPAGSSLLVSVLLRPPDDVVAADRVHLLTKAMALAARDACTACVRTPITLKWPNDLLAATSAGPRKLGGILAESLVEGGRVTAIVVGMGLNVEWPAELPEELSGIAVALNHLDGFAEGFSGRAELLGDLLRSLDGHYFGSLVLDRGDALLARYVEACGTLGQVVRVERSADVVEGRAVGISAAGHLLVEQIGGAVEEIVVGDVVHLRPGSAPDAGS